MTTIELPKKILDLEELGRSNGWTVQHEPYDDPIPGLEEALGIGFARVLEDGRELFFLVAYGRREDGRRSWVLLSDEKGFAVHAEVLEPTYALGADLARRWRAVSDLRHWLAHPDELVELWRDSGALAERRTLRDRLTRSNP